MTDRRKQVLDLIEARPAIQLREIGAELNLAVSTAHFYFTELRQSGAIVKQRCECCRAWTWVPSGGKGKK